MAKVEKWYKPSKVKSGWSKNDPAHLRRFRMQKAHKGDKLAAGRALIALANVTHDKETKQIARKDADYFFKKHSQN